MDARARARARFFLFIRAPSRVQFFIASCCRSRVSLTGSRVPFALPPLPSSSSPSPPTSSCRFFWLTALDPPLACSLGGSFVCSGSGDLDGARAYFFGPLGLASRRRRLWLRGRTCTRAHRHRARARARASKRSCQLRVVVLVVVVDRAARAALASALESQLFANACARLSRLLCCTCARARDRLSLLHAPILAAHLLVYVVSRVFAVDMRARTPRRYLIAF